MNLLTLEQQRMLSRVVRCYKEEDGICIQKADEFPKEPLDKVFHLNPHEDFEKHVDEYLHNLQVT